MYEKWLEQMLKENTAFYDEAITDVFEEREDIELISEAESSTRKKEIEDYIQSICDIIPREYGFSNNSEVNKGMYSIGVKKDINGNFSQLCFSFHDILDTTVTFNCDMLVQYESGKISRMELKKMQSIKSANGNIREKYNGSLIDLGCITTLEYTFSMMFLRDFKSRFGAWLN